MENTVTIGCSVTRIPIEIWFQIFEHVADIRRIMKFCMTCHTFAAYLRDDEFYKRLIGWTWRDPSVFSPAADFKPPEPWKTVCTRAYKLGGLRGIYLKNGDDIYTYDFEQSLYISGKYALVQTFGCGTEIYNITDASEIFRDLRENPLRACSRNLVWIDFYTSKTLTRDVSQYFQKGAGFYGHFHRIALDDVAWLKGRSASHCEEIRGATPRNTSLNVIDVRKMLSESAQKEIAEMLKKCAFMFEGHHPLIFTLGRSSL